MDTFNTAADFCPKAHPNVDSLSFFYNSCALILLTLLVKSCIFTQKRVGPFS